jgi:hypothetical protein
MVLTSHEEMAGLVGLAFAGVRKGGGRSGLRDPGWAEVRISGAEETPDSQKAVPTWDAAA